MNYLLITGNGFSIDLVKKLKKESKIDLINLFRHGHAIKFPGEKRPGFLSFRHCPALWELGARSHKEPEDVNSLVEEIITCSNMLSDYLQHPSNNTKRSQLIQSDPIHIRAYFELVAYIRFLFIEYNNYIENDEIRDLVNSNDWGWSEFLRKINVTDRAKLTVVTYNYDIWLERVLDVLGIAYSIAGIKEIDGAKIEIIKPHGSISFYSNESSQPFSISYSLDQLDLAVELESLKLEHSVMNKDTKSFLIPPAGDSSRQTSAGWATALRSRAENAAKALVDGDDVIICGMSYSHVDRKELDALLINLSHGVNFSFVNPSPPKDLNAVLMSLFKNYTVYMDSDSIGEII